MGRLALLVLLLAACDSRAKASDPHANDKSKEYETCGASTQCADDLRCFDHACRRQTRSAVGASRSVADAAVGCPPPPNSWSR